VLGAVYARGLQFSVFGHRIYGDHLLVRFRHSFRHSLLASHTT